jgi:enoyl-CoA hydratase/carnithine racemase
VTSRIGVEHEGAITVVTLTNPPVGALSAALIAELAEAIVALAHGSTKALVVRSGVSGYFGAGADLQLLRGASPSDFADYVKAVRRAIASVADLPCVTVAAIDGVALGGGLELALACDLRFAGSRARLGLPEVKLGLLPGAGGTQRLANVIGRSAAVELMLSGRQMGAEEALQLGLVNRVVDPPDTAAIDWCTRYCGTSPQAGEAIIRCVDTALSDPDHGMERELSEIVALFEDGDAPALIERFLRR